MMNVNLENVFSEYRLTPDFFSEAPDQKLIVRAIVCNQVKLKKKINGVFFRFSANRKEFLGFCNEHHLDIPPILENNKPFLIWGYKSDINKTTKLPVIFLDGAVAEQASSVVSAQTQTQLLSNPIQKTDNWSKIGLGSHDEWLFFTMKSRNMPPGIALWPQYRFRIDDKEYRVDFALVDTINCEIIGLIEIDGKQHKESVLEDRLRQHAIEKHSGVKIDRIDTETVRAMARKEGLL